MKRYRLCYRGLRNTFYAVDSRTGSRVSLGTHQKAEAERLLAAKNDAAEHSEMNLQIAQIYLKHSDTDLANRTWSETMETMAGLKTGPTRERYQLAIKDPAFDQLRRRKLVETNANHFLAVLKGGTVSTHVFLRRFHNFALGMLWIPWPILPPLQWPQVRHKEKRAVTREEHERICAREKNPEMNAYLQLLWHTGGSQTDVAVLRAEDVDWETRSISFNRRKTGVPVVISFGTEAAALLKALPASGHIFPRLAGLHEKHRAKLFAKRIATLGITGISLHSYRYAWANRAKRVGMPERFAQQALGHSSKALARAYPKNAKVIVPSLEDYEAKVIPFRKTAAQ